MAVFSKEFLWATVRIVLAVYLGLLVLVYFRQTRFIYFPEKTVDQAPDAIGLGFRDVTLHTADGETLAGWYVPAAVSNAPVLLFFHGNAGNIGGRLGSIRTFHDLGLDVLIVDYRGYGRSTGTPTEKGTVRDAEAAWAYLTDTLAVPAEQIIIFGRSLGGAVAVSLAGTHTPGMLVVESSFTSAVDMGQSMFPFLPVRLLCRHRYDSEATLRRVRCPVLIAHSPDDTTVPFALGERLYAAANPPKEFVTLSGDHNGGGMDSDPAYRAVFAAWVGRYIGFR